MKAAMAETIFGIYSSLDGLHIEIGFIITQHNDGGIFFVGKINFGIIDAVVVPRLIQFVRREIIRQGIRHIIEIGTQINAVVRTFDDFERLLIGLLTKSYLDIIAITPTVNKTTFVMVLSIKF